MHIKDRHQKLPRVLLVEDNPVIQFIHKKMLLSLNCQVDLASTGAEALQFSVNFYNLILLDIGLPDQSGIEVAQELVRRKISSETRIIALTALGVKSVEEACIAAGMHAVISKPICLEKLEELVYCPIEF